jgi:hypothetical protein
MMGGILSVIKKSRMTIGYERAGLKLTGLHPRHRHVLVALVVIYYLIGENLLYISKMRLNFFITIDRLTKAT